MVFDPVSSEFSSLTGACYRFHQLVILGFEPAIWTNENSAVLLLAKEEHVLTIWSLFHA